VPVTAAPPGVAPLAGVRVLDLTAFLAGPFASHQLGDLGADVVKVEPPGGDPARAGVGMTGGAPASPFMVALHRDRRSVVVDLKSEAGRSVALDLARRADVLLENFRPGVARRLGVAYEDLRPINPRIVYCSISGYGADCPASDHAAIDGPVQALAGAFDYTAVGEAPGEPMALTIADLAGGVTAVQAVLAALYRRERTGSGGVVDISLFESVLQWTVVGDRPRSLARPVTQVVRGSDGLAFVVQTPLHFQGRLLDLVARIPGHEDLADDPRFATPAARRANADEYLATLAAAFATRPRAQWLTDLRHAGVPAGPVQSVDEAMADPQLEHRRAVATLPVPGLGPTRVLLSPYVFDGSRKADTTPPPTLGEHTHEVLSEWLGLSRAEIARLGERGTFGTREES
jgi:CoA:oxalate CoA-transferase